MTFRLRSIISSWNVENCCNIPQPLSLISMHTVTACLSETKKHRVLCSPLIDLLHTLNILLVHLQKKKLSENPQTVWVGFGNMFALFCV